MTTPTRAPRATTEGPALAVLVRRLAATPGDLLDPRVVAPAVVADVVEHAEGPQPTWGDVTWAGLDALCGPTATPAARTGAMVAAWLATAPEVRASDEVSRALAAAVPAVSVAGGNQDPPPVVAAIQVLVTGPAAARPVADWVHDPEGREEAARAFLRALGLRPAGESDAEAEDRWYAISTSERALLAGELAEDVRRAEAVAAALAAQRARESAAHYINH